MDCAATLVMKVRHPALGSTPFRIVCCTKRFSRLQTHTIMPFLTSGAALDFVHFEATITKFVYVYASLIVRKHRISDIFG